MLMAEDGPESLEMVGVCTDIQLGISAALREVCSSVAMRSLILVIQHPFLGRDIIKDLFYLLMKGTEYAETMFWE
jgi:hypothetical protein